MGVSICLKLVCCNIFDKMADAETAKLPTVPETLLKKRKARTALRAKQIKAALLEKKKAKAKRATIFKRAEQYVKEYRRAEADELRLARDARKHGNFYVPSEAVCKRGYGKLQGRRCALTNEIIDQRLGKFGIICVEDLIHEIFAVGPHFKVANNFLWHFKLNNARGGWRKKANHFTEGGDFGNREELINRLLKKMI